MDRKELRRERRENFKPIFNGTGAPDIDGYHKSMLKHEDKWLSEEYKSAVEWCIENIGKPDDWISEKRWFTAGFAFYFTNKEDHLLFRLVFS